MTALGTAWRRRGQWVANSVVHGSLVQVRGVTGDVTVTIPGGNRQLYRVEDLPTNQPQLSVKRARNQPARLLQSRYAVIDFIGRESELGDLATWRDSDDPVSVLLLHGSGGQGKTRLATEFARISREVNWQVLQARHATDPVARSVAGHPQLPVEPASGTGVLMVVDYAERWPTTDLLELLADATRQAHRARVLLIARPAGVWWQTLANDLDRMEIETDELALRALADDAATSPEALFAVARDRFAETLDVAGTSDLGVPSPVRKNPEFRQALAMQMAALVVVDAHHRRHEGYRDLRPVLNSPAEVSAYLLRRERAHWDKLHAHARVRISADAMGQTAYTAALVGPQTYTDGLNAIARSEIGSTEPGDRILKDHAIPYPPGVTDDADDGRVLEPLYPDRLAEDFLALTVPGHHLASVYTPDPWSTDAPQRLLTTLSTDPSDTAPSAWIRSTLTVLIAAANRWDHVTSRQLMPLLKDHPHLAVQAGGAALAALANLPGLEPPVLEAIERCLPEGRHADFDPGSAVVAYRLAHHRLADTQDPHEHARVREHLAKRLHYAGLHKEAVTAAQDALPACRYLAKANPAFEPALAGALANLSMYMSEAGRREDALAPAQEAVAIRRRLAEVKQGAHQHETLAVALTNLGTSLSEVGRPKDALIPTREALAIRRQLTEANPAAHRHGLAGALTNLGIDLAEVEQRDEAVAATQEAVTLLRSLAEANPPAHQHELASALTNLGIHLSQVERHEEALVPAQEAVELFRRLAEVNPAAYEPSLASALSNLANRLSAVERHDEAATAAQEAKAIHLRLGEDGAR